MREDGWCICFRSPHLAYFLGSSTEGLEQLLSSTGWSSLPSCPQPFAPLLLCAVKGRKAPWPRCADMYFCRSHQLPKEAEGPSEGPGATALTEQS